jgi:hypothetical protein
MIRAMRVVTAAAIVLACTSHAAAHHSWTVEYDASKAVTVTGVVTKMEWTNPHTRVYVESKDDRGTVTAWNFEMASTVALERGGWSRRTLQAGTTVVIAGFEGREIRTKAIASAIKTADGKDLFVATPGQ